MKKTLWLEALNITENQLASWINDKPKEVSTAYWCLKNNHIDETSYIAWAKNNYQIPAMDHNYKNFTIDQEFWTQIQSVSNWSDQLIPLYFYENTLFILSSEPLDMNWSFPVQYVLGTPEQLSYFWVQLNNSVVASTTPSLEVNTEPATTLEVKKELLITKKPRSNSEVTPKLPPEMPSTNSIKPLREISENLKVDNIVSDELLNLNFETAKTSSNKPLSGFDELATQFNISSEEVNSDLKDNGDLLEGFDSLNSENSALTELEGLENLNLNLKAEPTTTELEGLNLNISAEQTQANDFQTDNISLSTKTPSEMPPLSTTTKSLRLNKVVEEKSKETTNKKPAHMGRSLGTKANEPAKRSTATVAAGPAKQLTTLSKVNQFFKKSLVFKLTNNQVSVSHQDGSWDLSSLQNIELTKTPSLFNFCLISKLPFHGPLSDNDSLKSQLFSSLNISNSTEHITLMPILHNNTIDHFVFATGDKQNLKNLSELEKTIPELLSEITIGA